MCSHGNGCQGWDAGVPHLSPERRDHERSDENTEERGARGKQCWRPGESGRGPGWAQEDATPVRGTLLRSP